MRVGIDYAGSRPGSLQPHRLPHNEQLVIRTGVDDNQITGRRCINGALDRATRQNVRWWFAADCHSHGVNGLLTIGGSYQEFSALRGRPTILRLLLNAARRYSRRNDGNNLRVTPRIYCGVKAANRYNPLRSAEAIVTGNILLIERERA